MSNDRATSTPFTKGLGFFVVLGIALLIILGIFVSPADVNQGESVRIMYAHVPGAWLAYLAFVMTAASSAAYLWKRTRSLTWDRIAGASAEVGAMVDYIEQELGDDCLAMFLQGAQGDLDPYDLHNLRGENRFNIARQAGISLGKGALRVAEELKGSGQSPKLLVKESLLTIPNRNGNKTTDVGLLTVVIGRDLALVAIPGEPFIQHQLDLTRKSLVANTFLLGLAYHGKGTPFVVYIPTVQAVKEGGYGATECSFLAADAGEKMVAEGLISIQQLTNAK